VSGPKELSAATIAGSTGVSAFCACATAIGMAPLIEVMPPGAGLCAVLTELPPHPTRAIAAASSAPIAVPVRM
jgi:hypothetical protein